MTQKMPHLCYRLMVLLISFIISIPCQAAPNESQIIQYIIEESKKERDVQDDTHMKEIADFAYGKAREFAKQNRDFARDVFGQVKEGELSGSKYDKATRSVQIVRLDENDYLIELKLEGHEMHDRGCLFVINPAKPKWIPVQLERRRGRRVIKSYAFTPDWISYMTPLFVDYEGSKQHEEEGTLDIYIFKDGTFKLLLSQETTLDEKKAEGVNFEDKDTYIDEYLKTAFTYVDNDIVQLYNHFAPKGDGVLREDDIWASLYFANSSKVFFHEQPDDTSNKNATIVKGDAIYGSEIKGSWILANHMDPKNAKVTTGWVKAEDLTWVWDPSTNHVCTR